MAKKAPKTPRPKHALEVDISDTEEQYAMLLTILIAHVNPDIEMNQTFAILVEMLANEEGFTEENAVLYGLRIGETCDISNDGQELH